MEPFTEEELLETINDMGYDLSPEELTIFKNEMDRFLDQLERESGQHFEDGSISFSSLNIPDAPYSRDEDRMFYAERFCCIPSYENMDMRKNQRNDTEGISLAPKIHGNKLDHDEILEILDDGYRCLQYITEDNDRLRDLNNRLEQSLHSSHLRLASLDVQKQVATAKNDEMQEESDGDERSDSTVVAVDPATRPVLCPLPGGVPFRHDPVKRYELYRKGWEKNPPPGEKKRLSLRWKVREFMLRQDVSRAKPAELARRRISNPEWSPRPYLD